MSLFISERPKTTYILIHRLFLDRLYHIIRIINAHPAPEGLVLLWELKRALAWFSCSSCFTWDSSLKMNLRRQTFKAQSLRAGFSLIICYSANMIMELVLTSSVLICGRWHHTTCSPLTLNCSVDKKLKTDWGLKLEPTCYSVHQIKKLNSLTNIVSVFFLFTFNSSCSLLRDSYSPSSWKTAGTLVIVTFISYAFSFDTYVILVISMDDTSSASLKQLIRGCRTFVG